MFSNTGNTLPRTSGVTRNAQYQHTNHTTSSHWHEAASVTLPLTTLILR